MGLTLTFNKLTTATLSTQEYLIRFGYLVKPDPRRGTLLDEKDVIPALKLLQRMAGIKETGKLDQETITLMNKDRCGMADFSPTDNVKRRKRYKKYGTKWNKGVSFSFILFASELRAIGTSSWTVGYTGQVHKVLKNISYYFHSC